MNQRKSYTGVLTVIYVAALVFTVLFFIYLGFSESLSRFVISLTAVLLMESVVYGYSIFWLRVGGNIRSSSPVLVSGAFVTIIYATAVFASALLLDGLLEIPPSGYAAVQLLIVGIGVTVLVVVGLYGRNAGIQEDQSERFSRNLHRFQKELADIRMLAHTWKNSECEQLVERIRSLEAKFKYSDPVSRPSLFATEDILSQQISLLRDHLELLINNVTQQQGDWQADTNELIESITVTLQRRNLELSALK